MIRANSGNRWPRLQSWPFIGVTNESSISFGDNSDDERWAAKSWPIGKLRKVTQSDWALKIERLFWDFMTWDFDVNLINIYIQCEENIPKESSVQRFGDKLRKFPQYF